MSSCANSQIEWRVTTNGEKYGLQRRNCKCEPWEDEKESGYNPFVSLSLLDYLPRMEFKSYAIAVKYLKKHYGENVKIIPREWRPA